MKKIKSLWLLLTAKGYFLMTDRGVASLIPLDREKLERVQDEVVRFDEWLEEQINTLILEERD